MSDLDPTEVSSLVAALGGPRDEQAVDQLFPILYGELRRLAAHYFRDERADHALQPTALVHEAYLRLLGSQATDDNLTRTHFFALTARAMRRVLIDHARARDRLRRGGGRRPVALDPEAATAWFVEDLQELGLALDQLAELDPRQARVVELRFFGGLTMEEIAQIVGVSKRTVETDWTHARAWLRTELDEADDE